ncbi:hypothetical protein [Streptomyces griseosporeus]|uniref:hypothetical protein n=1 Tax=Streptomyces griseosporeus TaxID=1910 RepID=UPI00167ED46B|nr:hypothetical protein [Streptomyces griseosporeus]
MKTSPQAVWVAYDGGNPPAHAGPDDLATGTDVINTRGTGTVSQQHRSTGATATVTLPEGQTYKAAAGAPHILRAAADGTTRDLPVTGLPFGAELTGTVVTGGSVRRAAVVHRLDGTARTGLVDLADGTLGVSVPGSTTVTSSDRWLVVGNLAARSSSAAPIPPPRSAASGCGSPRSTQGTVVAPDLKSNRNVATVNTGAPCSPSDIQAVDTWLYWSCGASGPAGVYDRAAGRAITVPAGQARLADGWLVRENRTTHELLLTDFHTGTATTRTVAVLQATDRDTGGNTGRWTVDRFGGQPRLPDRAGPGGDRHSGRPDLAGGPDGGADGRRPRPGRRRALAAGVAARQALHLDADPEHHGRHRRAHPHRRLRRRRGPRLLGRAVERRPTRHRQLHLDAHREASRRPGPGP